MERVRPSYEENTRRSRLMAQRSGPFGRCPACGNNVALDDEGKLKIHAKNPGLGAGSRKCRGGGKAPV